MIVENVQQIEIIDTILLVKYALKWIKINKITHNSRNGWV